MRVLAWLFTLSAPAVALLASPALADPCALEHGYYVCHEQSARGQTVNLSFVPARSVGTTTSAALVCSTNSSGIKAVAGSSEATSGEGFTALVSNHDEACADLSQLLFKAAGPWQLVVSFNDGDDAVFRFPVHP